MATSLASPRCAGTTRSVDRGLAGAFVLRFVIGTSVGSPGRGRLRPAARRGTRPVGDPPRRPPRACGVTGRPTPRGRAPAASGCRRTPPQPPSASFRVGPTSSSSSARSEANRVASPPSKAMSRSVGSATPLGDAAEDHEQPQVVGGSERCRSAVVGRCDQLPQPLARAPCPDPDHRNLPARPRTRRDHPRRVASPMVPSSGCLGGPFRPRVALDGRRCRWAPAAQRGHDHVGVAGQPGVQRRVRSTRSRTSSLVSRSTGPSACTIGRPCGRAAV